MAFCKNCGFMIDDETNICFNCGAIVEDDEKLETVYCRYCGEMIDEQCTVCPNCGKEVKKIQYVNSSNATIDQGKECNKWASLLLCLFLGEFGAHKFYEGKIVMGIIYVLTLGLFTIGWLADLIIILFKPNPYYVK